MGGCVGGDLNGPSILFNFGKYIIVESKMLIPVMGPKLSTVIRTKVVPN